MTHRLRTNAIVAAIIVSLAGPTGLVAQTPPLSGEWSVDVMKALTPEVLQGRLAYVQGQLDTYRPIYGETWADKTRLNFLQQAQSALRALLKLPPDASSTGGGGVGSGGGIGPTGTQLTPAARPAGGSTDTTEALNGPNSSYVLPLLVVLTAAQVAQCKNDNLSNTDCAIRTAERAALGITASVVPQIIKVISPAGAELASTFLFRANAVATAVTMLVTTGMTAAETVRTVRDATADLQAQRDLAAQQRTNAVRVTPAQMRALVEMYRGRLAAGRIAPPLGESVATERAALAEVVRRARAEYDTILGLNNIPALATAACRDASKHPVGYMADAQRRLSEMGPLGDTTVRNVAQARTLVATCSAENVREARTLYAGAQQNLKTLEQQGNDANADLTDAARFYAVVKAARANAGDINRRIGLLDDLIVETKNGSNRVTNAIAEYRRELLKAEQLNAGLALSVATLKSAFPPDPPIHIAEGLLDVDDLYRQTASSWLPRERLSEYLQQAADDESRVAGFRREALREMDDVSACNTFPDEMPTPLQASARTMATGINAAYTRAEAAVNEGKDVPANADACTRTTVVPPSVTRNIDGRMTGECTGPIRAVPDRGTVGSQLMIQVMIDPPFDSVITRVATDNPACRDNPACDAERASQGIFRTSLRFQAPAGATPTGGELGRFRVRFAAYDADNKLRCTGQTSELTVLAPRR